MRDQTERRAERRRSVFLRARVCGLLEGEEFECAIQDASRSGCKIISEFVETIPEMVSLTIHGLNETFVGKIVWRQANMAGVQFMPREADKA